MKWLNPLDSSSDRVAGWMVKAVIRENLGLNKIVLPKKYLNFSDIFNKIWADVLLLHS